MRETFLDITGASAAILPRIVALGDKHDVRVPRVTHLPDGRPAVIAHYAEQRLGSRVEVPGADVNVAAVDGHRVADAVVQR